MGTLADHIQLNLPGKGSVNEKMIAFFSDPANLGGGGGNLTSTGTTNVPLIVKGSALQTADLTQWQNSVGSVLASVAATGRISINTLGASVSGGMFRILSTDPATNDVGASIGMGGNAVTVGTVWTLLQSRKSAVGGDRGYFTISQFGGVYAGEVMRVNHDGTVGIREVAPAATLHVTAGAAATVGTIVKGFAAQTADLQQWQNSTGSVLAKVGSDGRITGTVDLVSPAVRTDNLYGFSGGSTPIIARPPSASVAGFVIRGAVSQTANLQEWQDSAGAVLLGVSSDGRLQSADVSTYINDTGVFLSRMTAKTAAQIPLVVKGFASQTADLQQWQNSTGAVLGRFAMNFKGTDPGFVMPGSARFGSDNGFVIINPAPTFGLYLGEGSDTGEIYLRRIVRWNEAAHQQTTVGAAGAAAALPATPTKYLRVKDSAGTTLVIPAYNA